MAVGPEELGAMWRRADEPVAGHRLAEALLDHDRYVRTRGVAQQAARAARAHRVGRDARRRLLAAAWVHDTAGAACDWRNALLVARVLRRAGHEPLARIVAHAGGGPMALALAHHSPLAREFPAPVGEDALLVRLLDVALLTTRADGAPGSPRDALRDRSERVGVQDPGVRALVALVAQMADDPAARRLIETLARR